MNEQEYLRQLEIKGISFVYYMPCDGGSMPIALSAKELHKFNQDPVGYLANYCEVSKAVYLEWMEHDRSVRCSAITRTGNRCKNIVPGGSDVDAKTYDVLKGAVCSRH